MMGFLGIILILNCLAAIGFICCLAFGAGNTGVQIVSWVMLALIIISIIILMYLLCSDNEKSKNTDNANNAGSKSKTATGGVVGLAYRIKKVTDEGATASFRLSELVNLIINLIDAAANLPADKYRYVYAIYSTYDKLNDKMYLNKQSLYRVFDEMIAHFDLVAPYYKYCGNPKIGPDDLFDEDKDDYRIRAATVLETSRLFSAEWMKLYGEFVKDFY